MFIPFLHLLCGPFCPFLFYITIWYQWIRWNGRRCQHVLAWCALSAGVILKGLTLRKCVSDVCVCMYRFIFVQGLGLWADLRMGWCTRRILKCLWQCLIVLRQPCAVYGTLKSSYKITNQRAWFISKIGRRLSLFHCFMPFFDKESTALVCILVLL